MPFLGGVVDEPRFPEVFIDKVNNVVTGFTSKGVASAMIGINGLFGGTMADEIAGAGDEAYQVLRTFIDNGRIEKLVERVVKSVDVAALRGTSCCRVFSLVAWAFLSIVGLFFLNMLHAAAFIIGIVVSLVIMYLLLDDAINAKVDGVKADVFGAVVPQLDSLFKEARKALSDDTWAKWAAETFPHLIKKKIAGFLRKFQISWKPRTESCC